MFECLMDGPDASHVGTLMAPGVLHRVIHGTPHPEKWQKDLISFRPAMLHDYRRHKVKHADYPALIPHKGSCVRGSLVTGLNRQDIRRLDIFEGHMYRRDPVKVQILKDVGLDEAAPEGIENDSTAVQEVDAQTYVWVLDVKKTLEPEEWDFEAFKREKMHVWMGIEKSSDGDTEVDEGFAEVDAAAAEWDEEERKEHETNGKARSHDPTGGRVAGGHITQQLQNEQL